MSRNDAQAGSSAVEEEGVDAANAGEADWWMDQERFPDEIREVFARLTRAVDAARQRAYSSPLRSEVRQELLADIERLCTAGNTLYFALRPLARVEAICADVPWC